jgi:hypothetical protein
MYARAGPHGTDQAWYEPERLFLGEGMAERPPEIDELLRPTLSPDITESPAIYSANALFLTAFFGGPFGLIGMAALNSQRLGRVRQEAGWLLLGLLLTIAFVAVVYRPGASTFGGLSQAGTGRVLWRAFALLLAAGAYVMHRRFYRSMSLVGLESPSPWTAGIACCVAGAVAHAAVIALVRM